MRDFEAGRAEFRFISPEHGTELFAMQVSLLPELALEVARLTGGNPAIISAVVVRMGQAISEEPMDETTVEYMREVLGVPEDEAQLGDWRRNLWDTLKAERDL